MTSGGSQDGRRSGPETSRGTARRLRSAAALWRGSLRRTDAAAAAVVVALALGVAAFLHARAQAAAHLAFAESAGRLQAAVAEKLTQPYEDLAALSSFVSAAEAVTRQQFRLLAGPMLARHRIVTAFEWLPFVAGRDRGALESEARAAGLIDYRFWEAGADGKPAEAGRREYYVPVHYMEPPNGFVLGFDVAADPLRWTTAEKARDSGQIAASHPFALLEDAGRADASPAVALYAPVYRDGDPGSEEGRRAALTGFALATFRVAPLVDVAGASVDSSGLAFALRDAEAPGAPVLARRPRAPVARSRAGYDLEFPVHFLDRRWALDVWPLPEGFLPATRGPITVAIFGALAAALGLVTVTALRTISRLRRQVEKVGPYRLIARLGQGAMGVVWEARHALLRRPTAVKLLAPGTEGERSLARFEREVQLTAGLTHPSTIAIYDYGRTADGVFYYAMELLRGINLFQLVNQEGPLTPARVVHLLRQACGALAEAHGAGLIHRDIKPANLMVCVYGGIPDFLKVLDFGLVKDVGTSELTAGNVADGHADVELSQDGSILGTPLYMAPEGMSDASKVDARADIFALGAVGFYLLTGKSPFPGRTAIEVFARERLGPPRPAAESPHSISAALDDALQRCLAFRRDDRPASAEELERLLDGCVESPAWTRDDARAWWRDRGATALAAARAQRQEGSQYLLLASGHRAPAERAGGGSTAAARP